MRERSGVYGKNQWEQLQNEPGQAPSSHIEPEPMPCSGLYSGVLDAFTRVLEARVRQHSKRWSEFRGCWGDRCLLVRMQHRIRSRHGFEFVAIAVTPRDGSLP